MRKWGNSDRKRSAAIYSFPRLLISSWALYQSLVWRVGITCPLPPEKSARGPFHTLVVAVGGPVAGGDGG